MGRMAKAMRAAMKAMKAMKAKKSIIARGKLAKSVVFRGTKDHTASGIKKTDLMRNKNGRIVTKKQNAAGKKAYKNIIWTVAVQKARKFLNVRGFQVVKKGTPLY